jgi:hypothetical protein
MAEQLVWANVLRPRIPLVYLDLNSIIYIARRLAGDSRVHPAYMRLYEAAVAAKSDKRALFPLGEAHLWEISRIKDPRQRRDLADVAEALSDYNYLLGRTLIAELEFQAGMAKIMLEDNSANSLALVRPTMGQVFGARGGVRFRNDDGSDGSELVRAGMADSEYDEMMETLNFEFERRILRGPSDDDEQELRQDPSYRPEIAISSHQSRVEWELDTKRTLDDNPGWRRGRLRDVIAAREVVHEWSDLLARLRIARVNSGLRPFDPSDDEMRTFLGSMPHTQVAVSIKSHYHRNEMHNWTANDISDIDALSVAYAYCDAVFPDRAMRAALRNCKELRSIPTFVPSQAEELADWLDARPKVVAPELLVPHPLPA